MSALLQQSMRSHEPQTIVAKSGIKVDVTEDIWQLLPTSGKGWRFDMSWVWSLAIPDKDREHMLTVYSHYATTKAANTTTNVVTNTKTLLSSGIPKLVTLKSHWSGLPTHNKKSLNQFFGTLVKLGYKQYNDYHSFTRAHLDKEKPDIFDPQKGALNQQEFDSFCASLNLRLQSFDWDEARALSFFRSQLFSYVARTVSSKLLTVTVRRPIQLSMLKWSDIIPAGNGFGDPAIDPLEEIKSLGTNQLQVRFFHAKGEGASWRTTPERYPLSLSPQNTELITRYKKLYTQGVKLWLEENGCNTYHDEMIDLMPNMPVFVHWSLFDQPITSTEQLRKLFTPKSRGFHAGESVVGSHIRQVKAESSRVKDCIVTSNRLRHTVLTRGAQAGYTAATLAKITGVTVPAARHYIDLDYESRLMIDELYIASDFLAEVFSNPLERVSENDTEVLDHEFNTVGST